VSSPLKTKQMVALIHTASRCTSATTITLEMDLLVVYYVLKTGKGATLWYNVLLQELSATYFKIKSERGHRLVVRWVPTDANLADPVSRGGTRPRKQIATSAIKGGSLLGSRVSQQSEELTGIEGRRPRILPMLVSFKVHKRLLSLCDSRPQNIVFKP
jgi:hypothetical protein